MFFMSALPEPHLGDLRLDVLEPLVQAVDLGEEVLYVGLARLARLRRYSELLANPDLHRPERLYSNDL
jgi:hypothetical protein